MSVQAGWGIYSAPRLDDASEYTEVEVGFPAWADDPNGDEPFPAHRVRGQAGWKRLMERGEFYNTHDPRKTVYAYVDMEVVIQVIKENGGMVGGELPPTRLEIPRGEIAQPKTVKLASSKALFDFV
jgi:hypothetical protein